MRAGATGPSSRTRPLPPACASSRDRAYQETPLPRKKSLYLSVRMVGHGIVQPVDQVDALPVLTIDTPDATGEGTASGGEAVVFG